MKPDLDIRITPDSDSALRDTVSAKLREYNVGKVGYADLVPLALAARDEGGELLGACFGDSYWSWLCIDILWVSEAQRRRGLGRRLLAAAETEARKRHCHSIFLDTFSFQARGFYEREGFEVFGSLDAFPAPHSRFYMKKDLR